MLDYISGMTDSFALETYLSLIHICSARRMKTYIIRRLLLMPLTLRGVTFLVFCITRFVPGGPIEQMMQQQSMSALSGQKAGSQRGDNNLSEADMERLEVY